MAQATFPITLTTADGLPAQTSDAAKSFNGWTSPTYTFAEPINGFRMTVTHCSWQDAMSTSANGSRGYVFFTMGEFYLYNAGGAKIALTVENFYCNALEAASTADGAGLAGLCDGDESTFMHTTYSTPEDGSPEPIGQEYYLEVTFPEPMTSFAFGFQKRSNNANIPNEIILTPLGVDADPFPDYEFQMGEKVDADEIQMGDMYVLSDEAAVEKYNGTVLYPAPNLVPGYSSASGQTAYHVRRNPTVDCIFVPIAAGVTDEEGKPYFYLRNYLTGTYVKNAAGFEEQAYSIAEAAKLHIVENNGLKFIVSDGGINYTTNSQASFVGYQDNMNRPLYFYKATIATKYLYQDLQNTIADAENQIATRKDAFAAADATEDLEKLQEAVAAAKTVASTAAADEINAAKATLETAISQFLLVQVYLWIDEVSNLLETVEFGTTFGCYPLAQQTILGELQEQLANDVDTRSFGDLADVEGYIAKVQKTLDEFYASMITDYSEWPLHLGDGSAVVFDPYDAHPSCYIYKSPTFFLENEVERIYITTVQTNTGDADGGWPCTNWAHFELYDGTGEKIDLRESNISTNALEESEGSIAGLIDYDEDGNPNFETYLHTLYSSSDKSTNEHYICIEFPEPMNMFRFTLISRENGRLVPTEMVIGPEPYHYVAPSNIELRDQVLTAAGIDPEKYYMLHGNINVVAQGGTGSGFYTSATTASDNQQDTGAVQFVPSGDGYMIYFPVGNYYLAQPTGWQNASTTSFPEEAAIWFVEDSKNLHDAFKIYAKGSFGDEGCPYAMLQDWSGSLGYFTVHYLYADQQPEGDANRVDDTDGGSDWTIFECDPPVYNVLTAQISKAGQLNTTDKYAMWGNLEVVSKGVEGSGFYKSINADGKTATNWDLFKLEDAGDGAYKIYFPAEAVYLKAPAGWAAMETTTDAAEAGKFFFKESENLSGAFKIYASGSWDKDGTNCPIMVLQDWGSYMGSFPIADWASDDTDGESDWTIYVNGEPEITLTRDDVLGTYNWTYDNYWEKTEIKEEVVVLEADPASEDGVIFNDWFGYGYPLKGVFDSETLTISFPTMQQLNSDDTYTYFFKNLSDETAPVVFKYDLINYIFIYRGQAGIVYRNDLEGTYPYWKQLSGSYIKLLPADTSIAPAKIEDAAVISTVIYNMNGQVMEAPVQGINIIKTIYDNGTVLVQKVLVK